MLKCIYYTFYLLYVYYMYVLMYLLYVYMLKTSYMKFSKTNF